MGFFHAQKHLRVFFNAAGRMAALLTENSGLHPDAARAYEAAF